MIEYVIKRDERKEPFDADKLNNWAQWGEKTVNPKDFNWSGIVLRTVSLLGKECTTKELQDTLIKECLNQNTWESNRMAGRLYASALSKELYEIRKHPHIKELHDKLINLGIVIKPNYTNEEYEYINKLLNHKRDFTYSHYAINQLVQKYSLRDRIKKVSYETPQFIYMRVAMDTLNFYTKEDRLEKLKDLYEELSFQRVVVPTPYFANSLTRNPNKISCSVITCTDEAESIGVLNTLAYTLTTSGAGVGAHMKTRSINDPVRGGLVKHAGKVPYYRAFANIMKSSTQGSRSGAATMYFPIFDPEIEVLVGLKNPLSVLANRVRDSDYGVSINKPFLKRAFTGKPFWLFSYKDNPELYEKFYHWDSETFDKELEQFAKDNPDKVTEVDAKQLLSTALTHRAETGRLYPHFADITNSHTPYKETIYSSNLCIAGDQLVPSNYGLLTAQELNELNTNLTLVDGQKEVKSSPMKLRESYQDVYKITLKNGMTHKVTNYHKIMTDKGLVKCEDLVPGVHKAKINVNEGIFGTKDMVDEAWLLGLWQGDGTSHKDLIFIDVWESKTECLKEEILEAYERVRTKYTGGYYTLRNGKSDKEIQKEYSKPQFNLCTKIGNKDKWRLQSNILSKYLNFEKNVIPRWVREGNKETQLAYIKGLFQTDGTYNYSANAHYLSITQTNKEFLEQLQILLNNLGYVFSLTKSKEGGERILPDSNRQPKLYNCKTSYRLVSGSFYTCLKFEEDTGFISFRGKFLPEPVKTVYKPKEYIKVVSVEYAGKEDVYCPTVESDEHLFVSHCFITRNCLEISNVTKPYKTHLELYSDNPEGVVGFCNLAGINLGVIKDDEEYERACYYALFMIEQAIETATLPFPALNKNLKDYRSAGVGICSLAYLMAKNNKSYTTQEGRDFIFEQAERHQYFLTKAAIKLTEELGPCEAMSRNKYKDGWLPSDSTPKAVFDLVTVGFKYDWESLRERMKELGGLRFTTLSCLMPAESSSIAVSGTNSIFPLRDLTLVKTSGDTSNIWVAPEASRLAKKYEIVWDIPSEHIINLYALWQVFIDQAISADIFIDRTKNVNLSMSSMFKDLAQAAKLGVKTFYYMNTLTDKKDTFEFLNGIESEEEPSQNNEDVGCSSGGCTL